MQAIRNIAALRALEAAASAAGLAPFALMRRAGEAAWAVIAERYPSAQKILVIAGPGANGGDGYVVAARANAAGRSVSVIALASGYDVDVATATARAEAAEAGISVLALPMADEAIAGDTRCAAFIAQADVVVDAAFGIGLARPLPAALLSLLKELPAVPIVALDVPSGVHADHGTVAEGAVRADLTVTFIAMKPGLATGAALDHVGEVVLADLDVESWASSAADPPQAWKLSEGDFAKLLMPIRQRPRNSHKGLFGKVLVIGGAATMPGAAALCAEAALRSGAGLVEVACAPSSKDVIAASLREAIVHRIHAPEHLDPLLACATVIAVGPGLGQAADAVAWLGRAMSAPLAKVVDADALTLLANDPYGFAQLTANDCITPHPGEAGRLLGISAAQVQSNRFESLAALCGRTEAAVVLKGAGTLIGQRGRIPRVIDAGNAGLATGGTGDILTGIIAALLGQGMHAFDAAVAGALLHGMAADHAASVDGGIGMMASDLLPVVRRLLR